MEQTHGKKKKILLAIFMTRLFTATVCLMYVRKLMKKCIVCSIGKASQCKHIYLDDNTLLISEGSSNITTQKVCHELNFNK